MLGQSHGDDAKNLHRAAPHDVRDRCKRIFGWRSSVTVGPKQCIAPYQHASPETRRLWVVPCRKTSNSNSATPFPLQHALHKNVV